MVVEEQCPDCEGQDIGCSFGDWSWATSTTPMNRSRGGHQSRRRVYRTADGSIVEERHDRRF
jgi:hypothetical protein